MGVLPSRNRDLGVEGDGGTAAAVVGRGGDTGGELGAADAADVCTEAAERRGGDAVKMLGAAAIAPSKLTSSVSTI